MSHRTKPTNPVHPAMTQMSLGIDSDQPGHPPSLIRVFAVRMKKLPIERLAKTLIRLGGCPGCFTALWHILGHFGCSQLTYSHCSWATLRGSVPVLSAHLFASNWQLPFLNQRKEENGRRNYFMTKLHERILPHVRIEPATARIPGGYRSDRVSAPGYFVWIYV